MTKTLILDIENFAHIGFVWGPKWETSVIEFLEEGYLLSVAYKWLGDKKVQTLTLADFPGFKKNHRDDRALCKAVHSLLCQADVVVAHNGDGHDLPWLTMRFLKHRMKPPSPYKSVDTLKMAKKLKLPSRKLDDVGGYYGIGRKRTTTGWHLWKSCWRGSRRAFKRMAAYNATDVELCERWYLLARPYMSHPNLSHLSRNPIACPTCESTKTKQNGWKYSACGKRAQRVCKDCGHYFLHGKHIRMDRV